jgi:hypothetical protein
MMDGCCCCDDDDDGYEGPEAVTGLYGDVRTASVVAATTAARLSHPRTRRVHN